MGHFFKALKAGVKGFMEGPDPTGYTIARRPLRCPHCSGTKFFPGSALVNTRGATLFGLDWANAGATVLICAECGRMEWFADDADVVEGEP